MKKLCKLVILSLLAALSATPTPVAGETAKKARPAANNYYLPRAGFPVLTRPGAGSDAELPVVNGLHLTPGMDRAAGAKSEAYDPGEPDLNMALVRWDSRRFPLKVWIGEGKKLAEEPMDMLKQTRVGEVCALLRDPRSFGELAQCQRWKPEMNDMVAAGFEQWRELENEGVIKFGFVDQPQNADIMVFFTDKFVGAEGPGGTDVHGNTVGQVFTADQVAQKIARGEPTVPVIIELKANEDFTRLQADAAHEFGHALGIKAHSPYREDIMYVTRIVDVLSAADKATLRQLYRHAPKYWYY